MTRDKLLKFYCLPLLFLCIASITVFGIYLYYDEVEVWLVFLSPALFLLSFIPWVVVDHYNMLEWED